MVGLKHILDNMEKVRKFRGTKAVKGGATRP